MNEAKQAPVSSPKVPSSFLALFALSCLALTGAFATVHSLNYPQRFAASCDRFDVAYGNWAGGIFDIVFFNALWIVPAALLFFLRQRRYAVVLYAWVSFIFGLLICEIAYESLTGYVNCYKDVGLATSFIGLFLMFEALILTVFSIAALAFSFVWRRLRDRAKEVTPA